MKKLSTLLTLFALILVVGIVQAQHNDKFRCFTEQRNNELLQEIPGLEKKQQEIEDFIRKKKIVYTQQKGNGKGKGGGTGTGGGGDTTGEGFEGVITIPVYIHVLYSNETENISNDQIQSQIDVLNADYNASNADISQVPSDFADAVAGTDIQFTWSSADIVRISSNTKSWSYKDDMKKAKKGSVPVDGYLNIWVCNIGKGILGYAQFPGGPAETDGVVISPQYFGSSDAGSDFYLEAPYNKGRTATHEVGHWLNLRHIWGDSGCGGADDYVADTPEASGPHYGCPAGPVESCGSVNMTMNYMDYVDDACMYMFTAGQAGRMRALFAEGGVRDNFVGGTTSTARKGGETKEIAFKSDDFKVSMYPNPTNTHTKISISLHTTEEALSVSLVDIKGRKISSEEFHEVSGTIEHTFDVNGLKPGIYLVNITGEHHSHVQKLVVTD